MDAPAGGWKSTMYKALKRKGNIVLLLLTIANVYLLMRKFGVISGKKSAYGGPSSGTKVSPVHVPFKTIHDIKKPPLAPAVPTSSPKKSPPWSENLNKPVIKTQPPTTKPPAPPTFKQEPLRPPTPGPQQRAGLRLPQCLIIGASRCGTNPLMTMLSLNPMIASVDGQINFFNKDENYLRGFQWYSEQMPNAAPDQILLERSPGYLYSAHAPKRVQAMNSNIKMIFIVRDPIKRVISSYARTLAMHNAENTSYTRFENLVIEPATGLVDTDNQAIDWSIYHVHLRRWLRAFSKEQILIVDGEKFIRNPISELRKVETFLNVEHAVTDQHLYFNSTSGFFCVKKNNIANCYKRSKGWEQPKVDHRILEKLRLFFSYHNQRFYKMTDQRFDWL